jgi:hypothetical protein
MCLCGVLVVGRVVGFPDPRPTPAATPEPITGSVVLLADGNGIAYTDPNGTCRGPKLAVIVSTTEVRLALSETDTGLGGCGQMFGPEPFPLTVPLAALGSRPLVDALTGNPVPYFDQQLGLHLTYGAGSGWSDTSNASGLPYGLLATDAPYFRSPGAAIMVEGLTQITQQTDGWRTTSEAQLIQVSGGGWHPPPGTVTTPVTVRGHSGLAATGIIVWTEHGITVAIQGHKAAPSPTPPFVVGGPPLDTAQLINLSNDLTGGSS